MFFRREKPRRVTYSDRLDSLKAMGFTVQPEGSATRVSKYGCAALVEDDGTQDPAVGKGGVVVGQELGQLVNGGYQQFFVTPSGKKLPALAQQLRALHDFQEDLREALGRPSLYNTSLGTISDSHMYDRVQGRPDQKAS